MSYLKVCMEASNAVRKATDDTINSCFNHIVDNIFDGKRNLLRFLLTPRSNLKQPQVDEIKQIFHTEFEKLIEIQSDDNHSDVMDIDQHTVIPTLINIAEPMQTLICSFLDFESINQLKNICSSITPIAISELFKMDINILNVHKLINKHTDKIKINNIIESSFKTYRIQRAHKLKSFIQNQTDITFDNLLCFKYINNKPLLIKINDSMTFRDLKCCSFLFMNKQLLPPQPNLNPLYGLKMMFIQEFNVKHQSLYITDIVLIPTITNVRYNDIKNINKINEDVTLYTVDRNDNVQQVNMSNYIYNNNIINISGSISTVLYDTNSNISESIMEEFKIANYKKLQPFYDNINDFYCMNATRPGSKYNTLALDLQNKYSDLVPYENISKCFKMAYDLRPNHPPFMYNYIDSLVNIGGDQDIEIANKLCLQKLKMYDDGLLDIPDPILCKLYCLMGRMNEYMGQSQDKIALQYYQKAVKLYKSQLITEKEIDIMFILRNPYYEQTDDLESELCETYYSIACIYEEAIEYKQDKTAREAEEYHVKMLKLQPNSAFHYQRYGDYLKDFRNKYKDAIGCYKKGARLIVSGNDDDWMNRDGSLPCCYFGWYDCLMKLKRYNDAEKLCLKWIKRAKDENGTKDLWLSDAYRKIISLYEDYLKKPQAAKMYSSMLKK